MAHHPEQRPGEVFLGNFARQDAGRIGWKTKRSGTKAFRKDGSPYPYQEHYSVLPYFAQLSELLEAGIKASADGIASSEVA